MDSIASNPTSSILNEMFENLSLKTSNDESLISMDRTSHPAPSSPSSTSSITSNYQKIPSKRAQSYRALGKIVTFMRKRFQSEKGADPLTLDEILLQTKQTNLSAEVREALSKEALPKNKRIEVSGNGKLYQFKPPFHLRSLGDLIELLKEYEENGLGGILMDDVRDSLPNYRQVLRNCDPHVLVVKRPFDRKSIVYYVDNETPAATSYELQAMWRSLGLEDIEEVYEPSDENCHF